MIVKCQTFKTTTFYKSATQRSGYLEREGRAIGGATTQNIVDNDRWYTEMDKTTERYSLRGCVIGREFILSPSLEDAATPEQMRDFAHQWLAECFPNSEAAVIIHADNKERMGRGEEPIAHAHVYVNAPDLETGRKTTLDNTRVRFIHDRAQDMSRERGWSEQEKYYDLDKGEVRTIKSKRAEHERRPKWQRLQERANPEYDASKAKRAGITRDEYEQARQGRSFEKTYIRRSLKEAKEQMIADPSLKLADAMKQRGVTIEKAKDGDLKFRREGSKLSFKGSTIGAQYGRDALESAIREGRSAAARQLSSGRGIAD